MENNRPNTPRGGMNPNQNNGNVNQFGNSNRSAGPMHFILQPDGNQNLDPRNLSQRIHGFCYNWDRYSPPTNNPPVSENPMNRLNMRGHQMNNATLQFGNVGGMSPNNSAVGATSIRRQQQFQHADGTVPQARPSLSPTYQNPLFPPANAYINSNFINNINNLALLNSENSTSSIPTVNGTINDYPLLPNDDNGLLQSVNNVANNTNSNFSEFNYVTPSNNILPRNNLDIPRQPLNNIRGVPYNTQEMADYSGFYVNNNFKPYVNTNSTLNCQNGNRPNPKYNQQANANNSADMPPNVLELPNAYFYVPCEDQNLRYDTAYSKNIYMPSSSGQNRFTPRNLQAPAANGINPVLNGNSSFTQHHVQESSNAVESCKSNRAKNFQCGNIQGNVPEMNGQLRYARDNIQGAPRNTRPNTAFNGQVPPSEDDIKAIRSRNDSEGVTSVLPNQKIQVWSKAIGTKPLVITVGDLANWVSHSNDGRVESLDERMRRQCQIDPGASSSNGQVNNPRNVNFNDIRRSNGDRFEANQPERLNLVRNQPQPNAEERMEIIEQPLIDPINSLFTVREWIGRPPIINIYRDTEISAKFLLYNLPSVSTQDCIIEFLRDYGQAVIEWPLVKKDANSPRGHLYAIFRSTANLKMLIAHCIPVEGKYFIRAKINEEMEAVLEIVPWCYQNAVFTRRLSQFRLLIIQIQVTNCPGLIDANLLSIVMEDLFGPVCQTIFHVGPLHYPIGTGYVRFACEDAYLKACAHTYVEINTGHYVEIVLIKPHIMF